MSRTDLSIKVHPNVFHGMLAGLDSIMPLEMLNRPLKIRFITSEDFASLLNGPNLVKV